MVPPVRLEVVDPIAAVDTFEVEVVEREKPQLGVEAVQIAELQPLVPLLAAAPSWLDVLRPHAVELVAVERPHAVAACAVVA
jgi:hypothetical protein